MTCTLPNQIKYPSINVKLFFLVLFFFYILFLPSTAISQEKNTSVNNEKTTDLFWKTSTPEKQGIDSNLLADMLDRIKKEELKIRSVLIVRNDHLILESYIHPYHRDVLHDVKSVSKSIISSLVGIALQKKIITGINQAVYDLLPEYFPDDINPIKMKINLENLLTMASGLDLDENGPIMGKIMANDNWIKGTLSQPITSEPGEQFNYCTLLTHIISAILTETSGISLLDYSQKYLFEPLDINRVHWEKGPQGFYFGGDKLWLTPRDMAKFGVLFVNKGKWKDKQLIPEEWIRESTINQFPNFDSDGFSGYGYGWWLSDNKSFHARGYGGQIISIYPDWNTVVVFTGADNHHWKTLTKEYIIPAIKRDRKLPPNISAQNRIYELTQSLQNPSPQTANPLPKTAASISGKRYIFNKNDLNFSEMTLWFKPQNKCRLMIRYENDILDLSVGLDNVYRISKNMKWGIKPENNTLALKGQWLDNNRFIIDFHEVGEPFYFDIEMIFENDKLKANFTWQPIDWQFNLKGVAESVQ